MSAFPYKKVLSAAFRGLQAGSGDLPFLPRPPFHPRPKNANRNRVQGNKFLL
jgi:hypothetical protein